MVLVDFHRTKYGPEVLVDCARVRDMPTFLLDDQPHTLTFYDIILITRGRGWFWLNAQRHAVRPGRVFFTTPGQLRRWRTRDLDGICFFFPALFLEEFFRDAMFLHRLPYFHVPDQACALTLRAEVAARLRRRLMTMRRELLALREDSNHLLRAQLYEALITLAREYSAAHRVEAARSPHPLVLQYRELVQRDCRHRHHVADFARELAVSSGHLNTLCKRHLGQSAKAVIQDALAVEARQILLYSDQSAEQIGYSLGFDDPSYFARFFRRATGRSPTAFRAESRRVAGK